MQTQRSNRQHIQGARQKAIYKELDGFSVSHGIRTFVSLHGKHKPLHIVVLRQVHRFDRKWYPKNGVAKCQTW